MYVSRPVASADVTDTTSNVDAISKPQASRPKYDTFCMLISPGSGHAMYVGSGTQTMLRKQESCQKPLCEWKQHVRFRRLIRRGQSCKGGRQRAIAPPP